MKKIVIIAFTIMVALTVSCGTIEMPKYDNKSSAAHEKTIEQTPNLEWIFGTWSLTTPYGKSIIIITTDNKIKSIDYINNQEYVEYGVFLINGDELKAKFPFDDGSSSSIVYILDQANERIYAGQEYYFEKIDKKS